MARKPSKSSLQLKADSLWSQVVRQQWGHCAICGNPRTEAHHLIGRSRRATRYEPMNGIALCAKHHKFSTELSAHGAPLAFAEWLQQCHPVIAAWVADNHRATVDRVTVEWYQDKINKLTELL